MTNLRINKILNLLIESCYLGIVFFVPIYFSLFIKNNSVFELNKIVIFKILILFLFLFTFIKLLIYNKERKIIKSLITGKRFIYLIIPFFYILVLAISTAFSINPENSIHGLYNRYQGLESQIFYFLFFLLLLININKKKQIKRIIIAIVISSFLASLFGLIQASGFDPFTWIESTQYRITSSFGQPNFFASFLLLVIPLSGYLFFKFKNFYLRFLLIIIFFSELLCLFFTYSRGAWIGLAVGIVFTFFISIIAGENKIFIKLFPEKKKILYLIFFLFTILTLVLYGANFQFQQRIKSLISLEGGSMELRKDFWQASIKAIKERPLLGYGLENQSEVLVKYYKKDWAVYSKINSYPNRVHNIFLDILLTSGAMGLLSYLALLYLFFRLAIKNIKNGSRLSLAIFIGVLSYFVSLFFSFSIVATEIYFWLLFSIIIILSQGDLEKNITRSSNREYIKNNIIKNSVIAIMITLSATAVFYVSYKEVKRLIADYYFRELRQAQANNEHFKSYVLYNYLKETGVKEKYYNRYFGETLANYIEDFKSLSLIKPGEEILKDILSNLNADTYQDIYTKAEIYKALASEDDREYYDLAEENFNKLISISPEIPKNYRELGKMYKKKEDYNNAIKYFNLALDQVPETYDFFVNQKDWVSYPQFHKYPYLGLTQRKAIEYEKYLNYLGLASVYFKKGDYDKAIEFFYLARNNNRYDNYIYSRMADIYIINKNYDTAIKNLVRGQSLEPWNYYWSLRLVKIFIAQKESDKALGYLKIAQELSPENKEVKNLIKAINGGM